MWVVGVRTGRVCAKQRGRSGRCQGWWPWCRTNRMRCAVRRTSTGRAPNPHQASTYSARPPTRGPPERRATHRKRANRDRWFPHAAREEGEAPEAAHFGAGRADPCRGSRRARRRAASGVGPAPARDRRASASWESRAEGAPSRAVREPAPRATPSARPPADTAAEPPAACSRCTRARRTLRRPRRRCTSRLRRRVWVRGRALGAAVPPPEPVHPLPCDDLSQGRPPRSAERGPVPSSGCDGRAGRGPRLPARDGAIATRPHPRIRPPAVAVLRWRSLPGASPAPPRSATRPRRRAVAPRGRRRPRTVPDSQCADCTATPTS